MDQPKMQKRKSSKEPVPLYIPVLYKFGYYNIYDCDRYHASITTYNLFDIIYDITSHFLSKSKIKKSETKTKNEINRKMEKKNKREIK